MFNAYKTAVIITAAGRGRRMAAPVPKQFMKLGNSTILEQTIERFNEISEIDDMILVLPADHMEYGKKLLENKQLNCDLSLVPGGGERQDSIYNALQELKKRSMPDDGIVLVHDGVRPYVEIGTVLGVLKASHEYGAAIPAVPVKETVRHIDDGTLDRSKLYNVQTPQGFKFGILYDSYKQAFADGFYGTDDAGLVERAGILPVIVPGSLSNIKITTVEDLAKNMRIGTGFDVHAFAENRKLILGGVEIPYERGLLGHSDADVLTHALMDALLGAAALGDIGKHFPDTDPKYKGASSVALLRHVVGLLRDEGYSIGNCDITVICQRPKLAEYIPTIRNILAEAMNIDLDCVSVKATTTEKLGFTGRGEGIAAEAVCTIESNC